jgi:hypothetical protein
MLDAPVGMTDRGSYLMLTLSVRRVLFSIGTVWLLSHYIVTIKNYPLSITP